MKLLMCLVLVLLASLVIYVKRTSMIVLHNLAIMTESVSMVLIVILALAFLVILVQFVKMNSMSVNLVRVCLVPVTIWEQVLCVLVPLDTLELFVQPKSMNVVLRLVFTELVQITLDLSAVIAHLVGLVHYVEQTFWSVSQVPVKMVVFATN